MRRIGLSLVIVGVLTSCASAQEAAPNLIDGNYYMAGDPACVQYQYRDGIPGIRCLNPQGQLTTYRRPMTVDELTLFYTVHGQAQEADRQFYEGLGKGNQALLDFSNQSH